MYRCHLHFYLTGQQCRAFEVIKKMSPLEHFTHEFSENDMPEESVAAKADVLLANLQDADVKGVLQTLLSGRNGDVELIALVSREQVSLLTDYLEKISDIWVLPMSEEETSFRFLRWQQNCKRDRDFRQTSQFFETTINSVPNLIWYKDKEGIHRKVNDSFCKAVNKTKGQVEGRGHAYIWDVEQDDPACIESENEVMSKRETCVSEEVVQTGDGTKLLTTYKSPLYDFDGSVMGTVGVAIDVTQERAYEQEILRKNHTLETIFTSIDCGVMCHTMDGSKILSINKAALKILGYESQEELMETGFHTIAPTVMKEDQQKLKDCIATLEKEGDSISVAYRVQHKNGDILHVMGNVKLIKENGELFYQRFLLDCTEQKLQEKKRERRQNELIRALTMDYAVVCFFDLDTGKGKLLQNDNNEPAYQSVFGGNEILLQDSMNQYIQDFVHEEDREMLKQAFSQERIRQELEKKRFFCVNYRACIYGEMKYFQMKAVRAGTLEGNYGIVLGLHNVDEETRNELEKKSLLEDALMQANRANKAKSVFLSNMSHDIRTPMNAIVGFTNLAVTHIDRKELVEEYLRKIETSGNHLLSLINDVLDMSRIESGRMRLEEKPCSLPDILHGLCNILQADIHAKQLELHMDTVDVFDEEIYCDRLRLNQVLLNLVGNSVKYTGVGGTVSMRITEKGGAPKGYANYEFYIRDTGIGMSEEFVKHIFEPFEREENTTISGIQGTGLGMAITKNIVDMMNGTIEVRSKQGEGTEFIVNFTFRLNSDTEEEKEIPELKDCRVLVVDDDYNTCDSVSYMFQQLGMRAEWTLSGKEAVLRTHQAVTRKDIYSIYVVDWLLPDMNGIEVTRRIRKEVGENAPIIILTAYDWSDIEDEAREAGVTSFCTKPLFLSDLKTCLNSVVNTGEEKEESDGGRMARVHTGRILLAEDVDLNQEIAVAILEDAGFQAEVAGNGKIAVDMLKKSEPGYYQMILMDVQMPVMNGYEATKEIRKLADKQLASIPIIAMTANAFEEDKREAIKSGMNGHIAKPIDVDELLRTLDGILAHA